METWKGLSLSTGHITEKDNETLTQEQSDLILKRDFGYMIYIWSDYEDWPDYSKELNSIIQYCRENNYRWLELDNGVEVSDKFPTFDW